MTYQTVYTCDVCENVIERPDDSYGPTTMGFLMPPRWVKITWEQGPMAGGDDKWHFDMCGEDCMAELQHRFDQLFLTENRNE